MLIIRCLRCYGEVMQLPETLRRAIEERADGVSLSALSQAAGRLSASYRQGLPAEMSGDLGRLAYLISRMPATFAAVHAVLQEVRQGSEFAVESVLDIGAGPGTAMWAAAAIFPEIRRFTLIERDREL